MLRTTALKLCLKLALAGIVGLMAVPSYAASWTLDPAASSLGFAVAQGGGTLEGSFGTFDAEIDLDPAALDSASIRATIDTGSASTGSAQFDGMLPNPDWFNVADFPTATFVSDSITSKGGNAYEAAGTLSIKDTSAPVTLDFTLDIDGDTAHAVGSTTLDRSNFGLGSNVGSDQVGSSVTVSFDLKASK